MKKRSKKEKKPSLLRKVIEVYYQDALQRKAKRNLSKLEWSSDYLTHVVNNIAKESDYDVSIELINSRGERMIITSTYIGKRVIADTDDSIFNHLDDNAAIDRFIQEHTTRRY